VTDRQNGKTLSALRRHGGPWLILAVAAPLAGGALLVWQAWTLGHVIGGAIETGIAVDTLAPSIALILGLLLTRAALAAIGERAGTAASETIKSKVRAALFSRLLAASPRAAEQPQSGAASAAIIDQAEAGIGDLITAYEPIERVYFNATHVSGESVTYSTDSTTR